MKAQALMIGDWVADGGENARVTSLTCDGIIETTRRISNIEVVEPIPLTPEILEKNGFENDFYEEESIADYHTIRLEGYSLRFNIGEINGYLVTWCNGGVNVTTDFCGCIQKDISFVHELQHALRLCGIEKEIEL